MVDLPTPTEWVDLRNASDPGDIDLASFDLLSEVSSGDGGSARDLVESVRAANGFLLQTLNDPESFEALLQIIEPGDAPDALIQQNPAAVLTDLAETGVAPDVILVPSDARPTDEAWLPDGVPAALVLDAEDNVVILVSEDLGFRSMILVMQEAYAQSFVIALELAGLLPETDGEVQREIFEFFRDEAIPLEEFLPSAEEIEIRFGGEIVSARPVPPAETGLTY